MYLNIMIRLEYWAINNIVIPNLFYTALRIGRKGNVLVL